MRCKPFSYLEKDERTFNHLVEYYQALFIGTSLSLIDNSLQKDSLEDHLKRNGVGTERTAEEAQRWVLQNSDPFRAYINSLKIVAMFLYINNKMNGIEVVTYEQFSKIIDLYRLEKETIIDTIRTN